MSVIRNMIWFIGVDVLDVVEGSIQSKDQDEEIDKSVILESL